MHTHPTADVTCFHLFWMGRRTVAAEVAMDEMERDMREHQALVAVGGGNVATQVDQLAADLKQAAAAAAVADSKMLAIIDKNNVEHNLHALESATQPDESDASGGGEIPADTSD